MNSVFILQHLHVLPDGEENIKMIGVYRTYDSALAAVFRLREQSGFADFPDVITADNSGSRDGFYIDEYELDADNWSEGFVTV
jgi:hypothetical protein